MTKDLILILEHLVWTSFAGSFKETHQFTAFLSTSVVLSDHSKQKQAEIQADDITVAKTHSQAKSTGGLKKVNTRPDLIQRQKFLV